MNGATAFDAVLAELRTLRVQDEEVYHVPQEPAWPMLDFEQYRLRWHPEPPEPLPEPLPLETVRENIVERILDYAAGDTRSMLLLRVPPGVGKTTASVQAVQRYVARSTRRVLYTASRKNFFEELRLVPGFRRVFWWNWLPLNSEDPVTCRYGSEMMLWIAKGYGSFDLCRQLCVRDRWIRECPYRKQRYRSEPVIFGRHAHLIHGMSIDDYTLGVCDEVPVSAFLETKRIPPESVPVAGLQGPLRELVHRLYRFTQTYQVLKGRSLLSLCGDLVGAVYDEIDIGGVHLPSVPYVRTADDVMKADYFYVFDLLKTMSKEYTCYRNDWPRWVPRVTVGENGITIYGRSYVQEKWSDTDTPLVLLDATGRAPLYRRLFNRDVIEYAPQVKRPGRVFQVVGRLNGMGSVYNHASPRRVTLTRTGRQLLQACEIIRDEYVGRVGIVTFKRLEGIFAERFGAENILHYGGLRGSNLLETCECLILAGGYCPNLNGLRYVAAALNPERMKPFFTLDDNGDPMNPWVQQECTYRLRRPDPRGTPARQVRGYWHDPDLAVLLEEYRQNELVQAIHRNRPINKPCDVWILTNIPTPEPLDGIYESLSDLDFTPDRRRVTDSNYYGITLPHWYTIKPHLDGEWSRQDVTLTSRMLAEVTGVTEATIVHDHWIQALLELCARTGRPWEAHTIRYTGRGRPRKSTDMRFAGLTVVVTQANHF